MPDPLSADKARKRISLPIIQCWMERLRVSKAVDTILSDLNALAVLLPPDQMLEAYERAGKVARVEHKLKLEKRTIPGTLMATYDVVVCSCGNEHTSMPDSPVYWIIEEGETP